MLESSQCRTLPAQPSSSKVAGTSDPTELFKHLDALQCISIPISSSNTAGSLCARHMAVQMDPLATVYSHLPIDGKDQIRLLILHPPRPGCGIECSLVVRRREYVLNKYYALSYTWGEPACRDSITVNGTIGIKVTDNLFAALGRLRDAKYGTDRTFWVDALCINQADSVERSLQVQRMREVYHSAERVMVWLGDCNYLERNAAASSLLRDEMFRQNLYQAVRETTPSWWERIWVWQEYAAANRPPIFCFGKVKIESGEFKELIQSLHKRSPQSKDHSSASVYANVKLKPDRVRTAIEHIASLKGCVDNLENLRTGSIEPSNLSFADMLQQTANAEATDPRDRLFSLIGFLKPKTADILKPDYKKSIGSVCAAGTYAYMLEVGITAALSRVRLSLSRIDGTAKPSWAMTFDTYPDFAEYTSKIPFNCLAPCLDGSRKDSPAVQFNQERDSIKLTGWRFDTIRETVDHPSAELPPNYNDLFAKFMTTSKTASRTEAYIDEEDRYDTADLDDALREYQDQLLRSTPGSNPFMAISPIEAAMRNPAYRPFLSPTTPEDHSRRIKRELRTVLQQRRQWMRDPWSDWDKEFSQKLQDVKKCMQHRRNSPNEAYAVFSQKLSAKGEDPGDVAMTWSECLNFGLYHYEKDLTICPVNFMRYTDAAVGRCAVFITSAGFVGVAPTPISQDDVVSIPFGSSMPVILRQVDEHYTFQGLAYVHGIMNGELAGVDVGSSVNIELETFEVR